MADTPKTFTQEEVNKMLEDQKTELREKTVEAIKEKNHEIKEKESALLSAGQDEFYDLTKWKVMKEMANDMVQSKALPSADNAFTVMVKMQAGREMGMKPLEAINSLYIVNGVVNIWGKAVARRIREHGWRIEYKDEKDSCTATVSKGDESYTDTFTFEDAKKSGFTGPENSLKVGWREGANRNLKLRYNVLSKIIKSYIPEVLGSAAEIAEVAEDTIPLYANESASKSNLSSEEAAKPATDAQKETIRNIISYGKLEANDKDYWDEQLDLMTFGQAAEKTRELMQQSKKKK